MMKRCLQAVAFLAVIVISYQQCSDGTFQIGNGCYQCPNGCITCTGSSSCSQCESGKWGAWCQHTCPGGCVGSICSASTGICTNGCYQGYTCPSCPVYCRNDVCEQSTLHCSQGCENGYYGDTCDRSCQYTYCSECANGRYSCTACDAGRYGPSCLATCPTKCLDDICDKTLGTCTNGCKNGYHGTSGCPCPEKCKNDRCDSTTAACTDGCEDGYHGTAGCPCPEGCVNDVCNINTAICTAGCKAGFHGTTGCPCPEQCKNGACDANTASCTEGCRDGYHGTTGCPCPEQCRNNACDSNTAACTDGCKDGYHGTTGCPCPDKCFNGVCDRYNAACTQGCNPGYHGSTTGCPCPDRCKNSVCNALTAACTEGCKAGYHGTTGCPCPANCKNDRCDSQTGHCSDGCDDGYYGDECTLNCFSNCKACTLDANSCTACKTGYYGTSCNMTCSANCKNKICDTSDGQCSDGCVDGFYGTTCTNECDSTCRTCSGATTCSVCKDGFYKSGGLCISCPDSCDKCTDQNTCTQCESGYYVSNGKCAACSNGCHACSSGGSCSTCKNGYNKKYSGGKYICEQCGPGCATCYSTVVYCKTCFDRFYFDAMTYKCHDCSEHCAKCTSPTSCSKCDAGYHGTTCGSLCPTNCRDKLCDKFNGQCLETCGDGFYGENCSMPCPGGCKSCLNSTHCLTCNPGHSGSVCCPDNCKDDQCESETGYCPECTNGYHGEKCTKTCSQTCISCLQSSGNCDECEVGFYGTDCSFTCSDSCALTNGALLCGIEDGACGNGCIVKTKRGLQCAEDCSEHCAGRECDQMTAMCDRGCKSGFHGDTCDDTCSTYCVNTTCHRNGTCVAGCVDGYTGSACIQALSAAGGDTSTSTAGAAAGGAIAGLLVIAALVVGIFLFRRRRGQRTEKSEPIETPKTTAGMSSRTGPIYSNTIDTEMNQRVRASSPASSKAEYERPPTELILDAKALDVRQQESTDDLDVTQQTNLHAEISPEVDPNGAYYNTSLIGRPVKLEDLQAFVTEKSKDSYKLEYQNLPRNLFKSYKESQKPSNLNKNRYKGIYPYDDTRVVLRDGGSDYINASYLAGFNSPNAYIAALGPTEATIPDFWRMVWQENTGKIVMLTKLFEAGTVKCWQYWPDAGCTSTHGAIIVTTDTEDSYADFVIRSFSVQKENDRRKVTHIHYIAWPDKGVPDDVTSLVEFRQKVKASATELSGPVIVHCSAGIGRTGTFVALDYLTMEGEAEGSVNILSCVLKLREHRVNMVQTEEQYIYLHHAVVHSLTFDCQNVAADQFNSHYMAVAKPVRQGVALLHRRFQELQNTIETNSKDEVSINKNKTFTKKNRVNSVIPADRYRPRLYLGMQQGDLDYINAVFINSYKAKNTFIVTQTPLPDTVVEFWKLVLQEKTPCIVVMEEDEDANAYWPSGKDTSTFGPFTISRTNCESYSDFTENKLSVHFEASSGTKDLEVTLFTYKGWSRNEVVPKSASSLLQLIEAVENASRPLNTDGPVVVHCLDGATRSGLFCAVSVLVEKIKVEQEVSVVNTIRQIKARRRQIIPTYEQYKFCHVAINAYLESFNTYSNFSLKM